MKKLILISSVACLTMFATIFIACNKKSFLSDIPKSLSFKVEKNSEGILKFDSEKDIKDYFTFLEKHSDQEVDSFEKSIGFVSYERKVNDILKAYEILNDDLNSKKLLDLEIIQKFRTKHEKYIKITDDDFFLLIEGMYRRLVNEEGYL
jgi:hypothetical protein